MPIQPLVTPHLSAMGHIAGASPKLWCQHCQKGMPHGFNKLAGGSGTSEGALRGALREFDVKCGGAERLWFVTVVLFSPPPKFYVFCHHNASAPTSSQCCMSHPHWLRCRASVAPCPMPSCSMAATPSQWWPVHPRFNAPMRVGSYFGDHGNPLVSDLFRGASR